MKTVVIGGTHHNTLSMVRSLGMKGAQVDVILEDIHGKNSYVLASRHVNKSYIVADGNEAVKVLRENYPINQPIILCSDDVAALLDENTAHFMDKQVQVEVAHRIGMNVPTSSIYEIGNRNIPNPEYPCVIKPLASIHGGKRFAICNNEKELQTTINSYETGDLVQIQQYIQRDYEIVVDGVSTGSEIIIPAYVHKHRDHNGGTDFCTVYPIKKIPEGVCEQIKQLVEAMNFRGLFGVEMIVSKGLYWFVEINLRNDATSYAIAVAGVNLPYIWAMNQQGEDYSNELKKEINIINSIVENRDIKHVLKGNISPWQWWKDYKSSECKYFYVKDDLQPYIVVRNQFFGSLFGKVIKRLK